jgi:hypothetical protein
VFFQLLQMEIQTKETRIILAIKAIRLSKTINTRTIAKLYRVPRTIFRDKITSRTPRDKIRPNCYKLIILKEDVISRNILELDSRRFIPRLTNIEDITNFILELRGVGRVSKL